MPKKIAVFVDYDNQQLDVFALIEYLREKGRVVIRRAYADWVTRQSYRKTVVQAGFELIDCPKISATHKNAADIRLAVDCLSISYENDDIEIYVFVTGDVDFVPLINKLRTQGRETIVVASNSSAAELLQQACDEYIPSYRLDQIETVSAGQLSFEESLPLLKKAYEQVKGKGYDTRRSDVKSLVKSQMLQFNNSFDEKDYDDCSSFTQYLDKARMFINLEGLFSERSGNRSVSPESKDNQAIQFPETLFIKAYNESMRRFGRPVTMPAFEKILFGIRPDISFKAYGVKNTKQLLGDFKEKGLVKISGSSFEVLPEIGLELTLKQLKLYHKPQLRKIVLSKIISVAKSWDSEKQDLTINGLVRSITGDGDAAFSKSDFNAIINILKFGGAFLSPDNFTVSSLNIPMRLRSFELSELEAIILSVSIFKIVQSSGIADSEEELGALAELLLGRQEKSQVQQVKKHLTQLEDDKLIMNKKKLWVKFRKS